MQVNQELAMLTGVVLILLFPKGNGMRCTKGRMANTVRIVRVILTELDSSSHTYKSICVINEMMPAMRENIPVACNEEG